MKPSFIRRMDALGRVVIPTELRQQAQITVNTDLLLTCTDNGISITPTQTACSICGEPASYSSGSLHLCPICHSRVSDRCKNG